MTDSTADTHKEFVAPTYAPGICLVKGQGAEVVDEDGKTYLDFGAGIAVHNIGHCHPRLVNAISQQAGTLMHVSNLYFNQKQPALARKLVEVSGLDAKVFFCNSGAEANEALIKLIRLWGSSQGKHEIVSMKSSFHGRTLAALAATGQPKYHEGFAPMPEGFRYADFNDFDSVAAQINDKTAAILLEAVQGEGGVIPADPAFIKKVKDLCDDKGILLVFDEVQCGVGRTGAWFGFQNYDVQPDAFTTAKALGGGFPIGACVAGPKLKDLFKPGHHASTFGGTPLACAAAEAVLSVVEEESLCQRAAEKGAWLKNQLIEAVGDLELVETVRGLGLMIGIVLTAPAAEAASKMQADGLIVIPTAGNVLRLVPPINATDDEFNRALEIISRVLTELNTVSD